MPPRIKITKETILDAAFEIVRVEGYEELNARRLAKELSCSTQPLYSNYENMELLKDDIMNLAEKYNSEFLLKSMQTANPFLNMGLAYIKFAYEERNLFKLLYMSNALQTTELESLLDTEGNPEVILMISQTTGLREKEAKEFFLAIWVATHGIATIYATNNIKLNEVENETILMNIFQGLMTKFKTNK